MDYHDPIDPPLNETCNGMRADDVLAQEGVPAPSHMLADEATSAFRLRAEFRTIAQKTADLSTPVTYPLSLAVQTLFWQAGPPAGAPDEIKSLLQQPAHAHDFAMAMADLAVSGQMAFKKFAGATVQ